MKDSISLVIFSREKKLLSSTLEFRSFFSAHIHTIFLYLHVVYILPADGRKSKTILLLLLPWITCFG